MVPQATTPVGRVDANGHGRGAIRFARLALELMGGRRTGVLIATFHCAAPGRCGAFAAGQRIELSVNWPAVLEAAACSNLSLSRRFGNGGAYGTELWVDPRRDLVRVILTQGLSAQVQPFIRKIKAIIEDEIDSER